MHTWAILIGSSTGGPRALIEFFEQLGDQFIGPIFLTQHIQASVAPLLARSIERTARRPVRIGLDNELVGNKEIVLAPGGAHMCIVGSWTAPAIRLDRGPPVQSCRPAVDPMFVSGARIFGRKAIAVILTGLGEDGLAGASAVKAHNGLVFAQDQATSIVWGMPGSVVKSGLADYVGPPRLLAAKILKVTKSTAP